MLVAAAACDGIPVMRFEAFDEPWKSAEGAAGAHWGLWKADRTENPALARVRTAFPTCAGGRE